MFAAGANDQAMLGEKEWRMRAMGPKPGNRPKKVGATDIE